jgi:hypothetical protein
MKRILWIFLVWSLEFTTTISFAATLATSHISKLDISLETAGDPWKDSCSLDLVSKNPKGSAKISLKGKNSLCPLFGPVNLITASSINHNSVIVIVQAAHGGDGEHTGPILDVYSFSKNEFKKLGSQELFDADYQRIDGALASVKGKVLFSFCDVCDGPDAADPNDNIYVPATLTFGCNGICVKPQISKQERNEIISLFNAAKSRAIKEKENPELQSYVLRLEKSFNDFLQRK